MPSPRTPSEHTPLLARARALLPHPAPHLRKARPDLLRILLAFFLELQIGMAEAALGSLLAAVQHAYGVSYSAVGFVSLADALGRMAGSVGAPFGVGRAGLQGWLYITTTTLALSFAINLFAPPFAAVLVALGLTGLASGALKPSLSTYIAHFHEGPLMSFVYAGEGLGALIQPFIVALLQQKSLPWNAYFVVPLGLALLTLPLIYLLFHGYEPPEDEEGAAPGGVRRWLGVLRRPAVLFGGALQMLAYSAEDVLSTWINVFMTDIRHGAPTAMQYVLAGYWAGETLSRTFLAGPTHAYGPRALLVLYLVCAVACMGALQGVRDVVGDGVLVGLFGFFLGPTIPTVLTTVCDTLPASLVSPANSVLMAFGVVGSGLAPVLVGFVNSAGGLRWLPAVLGGVGVVTVGVWVGSFGVMGRAEREGKGKGVGEDEEGGDEEGDGGDDESAS